MSDDVAVPYYFADLRATMSMRLIHLTTTWASMTFAVFTAAYVAGPSLDIFSIVSLIALHGIVVVGFIALSMVTFKSIRAIHLDALDWCAAIGKSPRILAPEVNDVAAIPKYISILMMALSWPAFVLYVLKQTGHLG